MPAEITAEIPDRQSARFEPSLRFLRRDQIALIGELFGNGLQRRVVHGPIVAIRERDNVVPERLDFPAKMGGTMPEKLPREENIKTLSARQRRQLKREPDLLH